MASSLNLELEQVQSEENNSFSEGIHLSYLPWEEMERFLELLEQDFLNFENRSEQQTPLRKLKTRKNRGKGKECAICFEHIRQSTSLIKNRFKNSKP